MSVFDSGTSYFMCNTLVSWSRVWRGTNVLLVRHFVCRKSKLNKKSYNVWKRDNGRYCWMGIREWSRSLNYLFFLLIGVGWGVPISVLDRSKNAKPVSVQRKTYKNIQILKELLLPPTAPTHRPPAPPPPPDTHTDSPYQLSSTLWLCDYASLTGVGLEARG